MGGLCPRGYYEVIDGEELNEIVRKAMIEKIEKRKNQDEEKYASKKDVELLSSAINQLRDHFKEFVTLNNMTDVAILGELNSQRGIIEEIESEIADFSGKGVKKEKKSE